MEANAPITPTVSEWSRDSALCSFTLARSFLSFLSLALFLSLVPLSHSSLSLLSPVSLSCSSFSLLSLVPLLFLFLVRLYRSLPFSRFSLSFLSLVPLSRSSLSFLSLVPLSRSFLSFFSTIWDVYTTHTKYVRLLTLNIWF